MQASRLSIGGNVVVATAAPPETSIRVVHLRGLTLAERLDQFLDVIRPPVGAIDNLSLRCVRWYGEVYQLIINESDRADFPGLLAKKVHDFRRFVINPIDHAPLMRPIMANSRVWEGWMFAHIQTLFDGFSPFDEDEKLEVGIENEFVSVLINWQRELFESEGLEFEGGRGWLDKDEVLALSANKARRLYIDLTDRALELESEERKLAILEREEDHFKVVIRTTEERTAAHVTALRESLAASEERLRDQHATIRDIYEEIIACLRDCLDRTRAELKKERGRVDALEKRVTELEAGIRSLESRLRLAEQRLANCESELSSDGGDGGCSIM